jgi:hypothetical protein
MINFIQESDTIKDFILSSTISNDIKRIFEKLVSRDVTSPHKHTPSSKALNVLTVCLGTCESCLGIPGFTARPLDDPLALWKKPFDKGGYQGIGREVIG